MLYRSVASGPHLTEYRASSVGATVRTSPAPALMRQHTSCTRLRFRAWASERCIAALFVGSPRHVVQSAVVVATTTQLRSPDFSPAHRGANRVNQSSPRVSLSKPACRLTNGVLLGFVWRVTLLPIASKSQGAVWTSDTMSINAPTCSCACPNQDAFQWLSATISPIT